MAECLLEGVCGDLGGIPEMSEKRQNLEIGTAVISAVHTTVIHDEITITTTLVKSKNKAPPWKLTFVRVFSSFIIIFF